MNSSFASIALATPNMREYSALCEQDARGGLTVHRPADSPAVFAEQRMWVDTEHIQATNFPSPLRLKLQVRAVMNVASLVPLEKCVTWPQRSELEHKAQIDYYDEAPPASFCHLLH